MERRIRITKIPQTSCLVVTEEDESLPSVNTAGQKRRREKFGTQQKMGETARKTEERKRIQLENRRLDLYNNGGAPPVKQEATAENWDSWSPAPKHSNSLDRMKKGSFSIQGKNLNFMQDDRAEQKQRMQSHKETLQHMLKRQNIVIRQQFASFASGGENSEEVQIPISVLYNKANQSQHYQKLVGKSRDRLLDQLRLNARYAAPDTADSIIRRGSKDWEKPDLRPLVRSVDPSSLKH